jgi:hypothetical protein
MPALSGQGSIGQGEEMKPHKCVECGKPVKLVVIIPKHCSRTCYNTNKVRRYRKKKSLQKLAKTRSKNT